MLFMQATARALTRSRLGRLNHVALTAESIATRGLKLVGGVANHIDPDMQEQRANIDWLKSQLNVPRFADPPYSTATNAQHMAAHFQLPRAHSFPSGFTANVGRVPTLLGRGEDVVCDALNHASLIGRRYRRSAGVSATG